MSGPSRVYGGLDSLEKRKLIEKIPGNSVARQPKPCYRATGDGVRSYQDWLVAHVDEEQRRQELWVRQLALFAHNPATASQLVQRFEAQHLKGVAEIARLPRVPSDSRAELIEDLVAEEHRIAVGGMLSWLRYARERFEAYREPGGLSRWSCSSLST